MAQLTQAVIFFNDESGNIIPGSRHFFYESGTTTPKPVYSNPALTTPLAQPVIASSDGILPQIWLEPGAYRWVGQDETGDQIFSRDNINLFDAEVNTTASIYFNSTADMVLGNAINGESVNLQVGQVANTVYDVAPDDGGGREYRIYDTNGGGDILLANGNFARLTGNVPTQADITNAIDTHNTDPAAHADIRSDVSQNTTDIGTNTTNIGTNTATITDLEDNLFKGFSFNCDATGTLLNTTTSYDGVEVSSVVSQGAGSYIVNFNQSITLTGWNFDTTDGVVTSQTLSVGSSVSSLTVQVFDLVGSPQDDPFQGTIFYQ